LPGHDLNPWPGPRYGQGTPRYPRGDRPSRCGDRHGGPAAGPPGAGSAPRVAGGPAVDAGRGGAGHDRRL